jgi:hypothetical protein
MNRLAVDVARALENARLHVLVAVEVEDAVLVAAVDVAAPAAPLAIAARRMLEASRFSFTRAFLFKSFKRNMGPHSTVYNQKSDE